VLTSCRVRHIRAPCECLAMSEHKPTATLLEHSENIAISGQNGTLINGEGSTGRRKLMADRRVLSITGKVIEENVIQHFKASLRGKLLRPGENGYDTARRVPNWTFDKYPGLIVRCTGAADVIRAVDFARSHDLLLAVRGGGHSFSGKSTCDGGLVIDLSAMKGIEVDPDRRSARAEAGLTLGEFDQATQAFGLATPLGTIPPTGIAGLTLGGGFGWLMGKYGLSCDNLLSVEVVTAEGRVLTASAHENADLFWGVRGGGGNFGVVTRFEYRLHPVERVWGGMVAYPVSQTREVLRFFREFASMAPDEFTAFSGIAPVAGAPACCIIGCYCGDLARGEQVLKPLRAFSRPTTDSFRPLSYVDMQNLLSELFFGGRVEPSDLLQLQLCSYAKAGFLRELSDGVIEALIAHAARAPLPGWFSFAEHFHGAVCRVDPSETVFGHREPSYNLETVMMWQDPAAASSSIGWVRDFWNAVLPFMSGGVYVNHVGDDEGEERVKAAYGVNYARLVNVKNKYDPTNLFQLNQNIKPTA
jgi:FAD/FMN-containing dehydrogenase